MATSAVGAGRAVADGRPADGRDVRHAGARGAGDADPFAADLAAELEAQIREHAVWWPVDVPAAELAAAMVPMHDTPLGPLADGLTLRQIGLQDRLRELDFEFPLAGGDLRGGGAGHPAVATSARCCARTCRPTTRWRRTPTG